MSYFNGNNDFQKLSKRLSNILFSRSAFVAAIRYENVVDHRKRSCKITVVNNKRSTFGEN